MPNLAREHFTFTPFSFYGLGTVSLSADHWETRSRISSSSHGFAVSVRGDRLGMMTLTVDSSSSVEDSSALMELLNILSARMVEQFERQGIDLDMGTPNELTQKSIQLLDSQPAEKVLSWKGLFQSRELMEFIFTYREIESGQLYTDSTMWVADPIISEEKSCSPISSHSLSKP